MTLLLQLLLLRLSLKHQSGPDLGHDPRRCSVLKPVSCRVWCTLSPTQNSTSTRLRHVTTISQDALNKFQGKAKTWEGQLVGEGIEDLLV